MSTCKKQQSLFECLLHNSCGPNVNSRVARCRIKAEACQVLLYAIPFMKKLYHFLAHHNTTSSGQSGYAKQFLTILARYYNWQALTFSTLKIWQELTIKMCDEWTFGWKFVRNDAASASRDVFLASIRDVLDNANLLTSTPAAARAGVTIIIA